MRPLLEDDAIRLTWNVSVGGAENGYEVQVIDDSRQHLGWQNVPVTGIDDTVFTGVENRTRYNFRIRELTPDGALPWSGPVPAVYVDPVLPVVRINTDNAQPILDRENYVNGEFTLDPNGSDYDAASGRLEIRGRGNSTWGASKKPYRVRLETSTSLMGIAKSRHWVLLANAYDKSQLRSYTAGEIAHSTDLAWSQTYRHVELILNGDYVGVYQLTEQVRIAGDRVDIEEMSPDDNEGDAVTGGYLLEIDARLEENNEPGFRTNKNMPIVIKDPDQQLHNSATTYATMCRPLRMHSLRRITPIPRTGIANT